MINKLVEQYGIYLLLIIYLVINFVYKNYLNIGIFFLSLCATINLVENKNNSLIIAYIISICYGIMNNFHLLENFKSQTFEKSKPIKIKESSKITSIKDELNKQKVEVKQQQIAPVNIKSLVSTRLIQKFIEKLKMHDNSLVIYKTVYNDDLKPTIAELNSKKIKKMLEIYGNRKNVGDTPIVISNDNFIVDGHHRWYSYKQHCESNNSEETMKVILIDLPLPKLITRMKEYKIEYNDDLYKKFKIDNNSLIKANNCIKNIKVNINELDKHYKNIQKIKLI